MMDTALVEEDIAFDSCGRMLYHPEFHSKHGTPWSESDKEYLCKYWEIDGMRLMPYALERPETSLAHMVCKLRKNGKFEYYKTLGKFW